MDHQPVRAPRTGRAPAPPRVRAVAVCTGWGLVAFLAYAALGLLRYRGGRVGSYDLGIFAQAARGWASGTGPVSDVRGPGYLLLQEHFSPVTVLFAPGWWLWPDPRSLVLTQALLLAGAVAVVATAATRRLPPPAAAAAVVAFAASYGVVGAARFDVHEVAFAAPALAVVCTALLEHRPRLAFWAAVPLVLVKEDLGATVCAVALVLWWQGRRAWAVRTAVLGVAGGLVGVGTVVWFNPQHTVPFLGFLTGTTATADTPLAARAGDTAVLLVLLLLTGGVVWVRSPLAVLVVPTLLWRLASSNPSYWSPHLHYDLVLMPVVSLALLDVLGRRTPRPGRARAWVRPAALTCAVGTAVAALLAHPPLPRPAQAWTADVDRRVQTAAARIPDGATVAADNDTGPYLVSRLRVRMWSYDHSTRARWVLVDTTRGSSAAPLPGKEATLAALRGQPGVAVEQVGDYAVIELPCEGWVRQVRPAAPRPQPDPVWETGCA
ncbi:DUF2079 domain-containing protein [Kineococcus sp. LSe6-4]|uniref:DUF2079 domain-containing protein n=1 Tax=Kineococcus halophytocola TaxID=3234027 RepID=A0ABV4H5F0_9ACTN